MQKKNLRILMLWVLIPFSGTFAQLTIEQCQQKARQNYPQIKQFEWIDQSATYHLSNVGKANLPQVTFSAKGSYQSDAINFERSFGGNTFAIKQSKDQYQAVVDVNQVVWDGGISTTQKKMVKVGAEVEKQKLEVDLYTIRDRVNQLFFGVLLFNKQLEQNDTLQHEWESQYNKINACVKSGIAHQADLDAICVEMLNNQQRHTELAAGKKSYVQMLSAMIGEKVDESSKLETPVVSGVSPLDTIVLRPELTLFDRQLGLLDNQIRLTQTSVCPKMGLFLQGGYGKPGLNMLMDDFAPFYIGGVRLTWSIGGFYTLKNTLNTLRLNKETVQNQRETFLFNNRLKMDQQNNEVQKIQELLAKDDEIIWLRTRIKDACSVRVEKGVQTVTDLVREIHAESLAKQQKSLHEIQLILSIYNYKYSTNH